MTWVLYLIIACGALSIAYGVWTTRAVLAADPGNARMQEIAGAIREAGYVAELDLSEKTLSSSRWVLDVRDKPPLFALQAKDRGKRFEAGTAREVLKLLEREGG